MTAKYARIRAETVVEIVDLDPALHASWVETGDPKANTYLPLMDVPPPWYDPARQALVEVFDVGLANVVRFWSIRPLG